MNAAHGESERSRAATVILLLALAGCHTTYGGGPDGLVGPDVNLGKEKRLSFSSRCCIRPGCVVSPFMRRTVDYVHVVGDALPFEIQALSTGENVFTVRTTSLTRVIVNNQPPTASWKIYIETKARGRAELKILDKAGTLLDRIDIEVRDAARHAFSSSTTIARSVTVVTRLALAVSHPPDAGTETVYIVPYDATGERLQANAGFTFSSKDETVVGVKPGTDCLLTVCFGSGDRFRAIARAPGDTDIEVSGGEVVGKLPVSVSP